MKIAFVTSRFPVLSDTPFLNQITGLIARGQDVDIYSDQPQEGVPYHPDVDRYDLLSRTTYVRTLPKRRAERLRLVRQTLRDAEPDERRMLLRSLNPLVYWKRALSLDQFRRTATYLPRRDYDICQCAFGYDGLKAVRVRRTGALGGRLVVSFRGADTTSYVARRHPLVYARVFREAAVLMPVSETLAELLRRMGAPEEKIHVHRTGIDLTRYAFRPRRREAGEPVRFVTVARLVEKKGIDYALEALRRLLDGGTEFRYDVLGGGPLHAHLEARAAALGIADRVVFHGWAAQTEVREALERCHLLLQPSVTAANGDQEGVPNVLKEAMAAGVPVVGTRHGGIPELIDDGVEGRLVPERSAEALSAAIADLVRHAARWPDIGAAGRARVERDYDIDKLNDRLLDIYERLIRTPERR